jgi:hypothetical protein
MRLTFGSAILLGTLARPAAAQQQQKPQQQQTGANFNWSGKVPAGKWIRVRNLNGGIIVGQASGDNVEVTGTKKWRRGDPATVRFETKTSTDGSVTICALWGERSSCDERHYDTRGDRGDRGDRNTRNNDVSVQFRVLLPRGVKVSANTVNGEVRVDGATTEVDANTVNGEVDATTSGGRVSASNVNGGVHVRLGRVEPDGNMELTTVNGNVTLEIPGDLNADVDMETVTGSLNTGFEMTVTGRMDPHHLRTHVGRPGGPRIRLETVNGNVELRKR